MTKNNGFKVAALAASIALAMGATSAMAADPATNALPGQGKVTGTVSSAITGTTAAPILTITTTGASAVIDWGKDATTAGINNTGTAGFNIGKAATVNFTGATAGVLNIDSTGNASQIFGALNSDKNVYVANANGIIVGADAAIDSTGGDVGLIANTRGTTTFDGTVVAASVEFQGAGGDVTVAKGATIDGANVLVSGGGTVNVDLSTLTSGNATVQAGVKNSTSTLVTNNSNASLVATGDLGGATLASFASAGNASTSGTLSFGANAAVAGTLTNTGDLTLAAGFNPAGSLVNNKTVTQGAATSMGSLVNNGAYTGGGFALTTTKGGVTNGGSMTGLGTVTLTKGDLVNNGTFDAGTNGLVVNGGGNVTNQGTATLSSVSINQGGNFSNAGTMTLTGGVNVVNGSITNSGKLTVDGNVETSSDMTTGNGYAAGSQYYINNTGTITSGASGDLYLSANSDYWGDYDSTTGNDSTGSVTNSGILQVGSGGYLELAAHNGVVLGGSVQAKSGSSYKALSATNPLAGLGIYAGGYDGATLNTEGVATVSTDLVSDNSGVAIYGNQVKLMSNLSVLDSAGDPDGTLAVVAGAKSATDYAVRVAGGKTVTAKTINVNGDQAGDESNVILQGTLAAQDINFGGVNAVSDVFSGPAGGLSLSKVLANPSLQFHFTGAVKTAKYNNSSNFRFNGLSAMTDGNPLALTLDPTKYTTNGTNNGLSAVNLLVNGDVNLTSTPTATVAANGSAVTGVTNIPNTHLVLQSSGNIATVGNFYWPGYVYLGNVAADGDGNAQPGTLGLGTITTGGNFNNVLPGDIAGASGIHFITQFPMTLGGNVVTNATAWVNFGTDLLTQKYSSEQNATTGPFFGGTQGSGSVVNYGVLDAGSFHTHAPDATK